MGGTKGFTLVELLIVVIIIGILSAVAIPQFGESTTDAKLCALDADLCAMRNAIECYCIEHKGVYPGVIQTHDDADPPPVPKPHDDEAEAWVTQLTTYSDEDGNTSETRSASYPKGPYLRAIPKNPLAASGSDEDGVVVTTDAGPMAADVSPSTGWKASNVTGNVIANVSEYETR